MPGAAGAALAPQEAPTTRPAGSRSGSLRRPATAGAPYGQVHGLFAQSPAGYSTTTLRCSPDEAVYHTEHLHLGVHHTPMSARQQVKIIDVTGDQAEARHIMRRGPGWQVT